MADFIHIIFNYPTIVFTILGGVAFVYWLFVMLGALDIDMFDFGDAHGHGDAGDFGDAGHDFGDAGHGHDVGDAGHVGHGHGDAGDAGGEGAGGLSGLLGALKLRNAPLTITLSVMILTCWLICALGSFYLGPLLPIPLWISGTITLLTALIASVPITSLATRPLKGLFVIHGATTSNQLIGKECQVRLRPGAGKAGQARVEDGGAGLLVRVRVDEGTELKRGEKALIVDYDPETDTFAVEPMKALLSGKEKAG